jgi:hypothetical protein
MNISGVNDLMRSDYLSGGNISGVALQLLIEQDESRLTSSAEEIRNSAKDISKQILRLYKQFAVVNHTSRIVGENGSVELFYWKGCDINSEEIIFETENEINESLAQKRSMIFEILNAGLLHSEDGKLSNSMRSKILEQLGFGVWETSQDVKTLHKNKAAKENIELLDDSIVNDPLEVDDHDIHINEHIVFMLGNEFDRHSKKNHKIVEKMLEHIRMHKKFKSVTLQIENKGE